MSTGRWLAVIIFCALASACQGDRPPTGADRPQVPAGLPVEVLGATWQWIGVTGSLEPAAIGAPERYTISFAPEGHVAVRADCNRGAGSYVAGAGRSLSLGALALTRAACPPGSLSDRYVRDLSRVIGHTLSGNEFHLELPAGAGALRFRRAG